MSKLSPSNNKNNIVLIGHMGSGKSTLLNLIVKLYNIDNGKIINDGSFENVFPDFEKEMRRRANVSD